ncbi:MAG: 1-acyl-sn-glycerol-3-phosphate acyltransferase [Treponema sp.]|nr:1-acyl-sn-glycerol-3-phosphate acyltransferase [Treponema sp.]
MSSAIAIICILCMVGGPAFLNIIAYPVSYKWSLAISDYIVNVLAHRLFVVLNCYKKFHFFAYREMDKELPEQFLVISNHQSLLDIPAYMNYFHNWKTLRFVAKDTLSRHIPLVSEMLRTQEHCMVPRKAKPMEAMKYMEKFGKRCAARNQCPVLFPEGTRTRTGQVGKFYSAGFRKLAESTGLPVVVCALDGGWELRDLMKIMSNLKNGSYRVKVLKIYENPKTKEEQQLILDESKVLIQAQLDEWRKKPSNIR